MIHSSKGGGNAKKAEGPFFLALKTTRYGQQQKPKVANPNQQNQMLFVK